MDGDLTGQDQEQRVAEAALDHDRLVRVVALDLAGRGDALELLGLEVHKQRVALEQRRIRHEA